MAVDGVKSLRRENWSVNDPVVHGWTSDLIWRCFDGILLPPGSVPPPAEMPKGVMLGEDIGKLAATVGRETLVFHEMQGIAFAIYGDKLDGLFDAAFRAQLVDDFQRTDVLMQDLRWVLAPKLDTQVLPLRAAAMRPAYPYVGTKKMHPRIINTLTLWAPTLTAREEIITLLGEAGYALVQNPKELTEGYVLNKRTGSVVHSIYLRSSLWETTKNWSADFERSIWDRAVQSPATALMQPETADLFILGCRHFSIDNLVGGAVELLDLIMILDQAGDLFDWGRVRDVTHVFSRPDWLWAALHAVHVYERRSGRNFSMPQWVSRALDDFSTSFLGEFVESRLLWANPDTKSTDFTRAFVKLSKGN